MTLFKPKNICCLNQDTIAEIDYVFIEHNQLTSRFKKASSFCVAETGFGAGLSFLRIMQVWLKQAKNKNETLHFVAFEDTPFSKSELQKLHHPFSELRNLSKLLLSSYPYILPGWHSIDFVKHQVKLTLWFGDVLQGLPEMDVKVDVWLFGSFGSPNNEPSWKPSVYSQMARLSHKQTSFSGLEVSAELCRGLQKYGFKVQNNAGFKNKQEICFGKISQLYPNSSKTPWFSLPRHKFKTKTAIVVGAGLAGATAAYKLACKGWQVTILEKNTKVAQEASGNLAGAIHPLVTADWNLRSQWYLKGFETTLKWLKPWFKTQSIIGNLNGLIHLAATETTHKRMLESMRRVGLPNDFAQWKTSEQNSTLAGCSVNYPGLFFPNGGWVQPASIIHKCLSHPNIECLTQTKVVEFSKQENFWVVQTQQKHIIKAEILIIATAGLDSKLNQKLDLPIRPVKGQVTHLKKQAVSTDLNVVITHKGYSLSLDEGTHITGATFEAPCLENKLSSLADIENINMAKESMPSWTVPFKDPKEIVQGGKTGFRPTTPDHLPIIGPIAQTDFLLKHYLSQSHSHAAYRYPEQQYHQGLYVSNGHGARGLMSVFMAAEIISDMIHQQPLNLPSSLYQASHPARFKIRDWRKGRLFPVKAVN